MKKKVQPKKPTRLTAKQYAEIYRLYWEEGWAQADISLEFMGHGNQGHVSRIINGPPPMSWEEHRQAKSAHTKSYKTPRYKTPWMKRVVETNRSRSTAKLTFKKAEDIRHTYFKGQHTQMDLAKKYGVNQATICGVVIGRHWKKL